MLAMTILTASARTFLASVKLVLIALLYVHTEHRTIYCARRVLLDWCVDELHFRKLIHYLDSIGSRRFVFILFRTDYYTQISIIGILVLQISLYFGMVKSSYV